MKRVILDVPTDKLKVLCDDLMFENKNIQVVPKANGNWDVYYFPK